MSLYKSPPIRERRQGQAVFDTNDGEYLLSVTFDYHEWSEPHAYGSTWAYERLCEHENYEYELDHEMVDRDMLVTRFGEEAVKEAEEMATENAL